MRFAQIAAPQWLLPCACVGKPVAGLARWGGGLHQQFTKAENRTIGGKIELLATWDLKVAVYVLILL